MCPSSDSYWHAPADKPVSNAGVVVCRALYRLKGLSSGAAGQKFLEDRAMKYR